MRVALVEPSRTVRRIVTETITEWGHDVCAFDDGHETLAFLAANENARALITSIELPTGSGIELVKNARALAGRRRPLYILVMSCSEERSKVVTALDSGADDFISKPPELNELHARLRAAERMTSMQAQLVELATTDGLTGLLNRRAFVERLGDSISRWNGASSPVSVLMGDLDKFKAINDSFGHEIGDRVLKAVAGELKKLNSPAGRLGGEEFAVLLNASIGDAAAIGERLCRSVNTLAIETELAAVKITCSLGVATLEHGDTVDSTLRHADIALYEAKRLGGNRVVVADEFLITKAHRQWRGAARQIERPETDH